MYATQDDLVTEFGERELLDVAGTGDQANRVLDAAKIANALTDVTETMNGYIKGRYTLPLNPVPGLLRPIACDLARYRLRNRSAGKSTMTDEVRQRFEDAIKQLKDIAAGRLLLDIPSSEATPTETRVISKSAEPVFTTDNGLLGY